MSHDQNPETGSGEAGGMPPAAEPPANALTDSGFGRVLGVVFSPVATFRSIARRPTWVVPFVLISLVVAAVQIVTVPRLDTSDVRDQVEAQLEARGQQLSDEELDNAIALQMNIGLGCGIVFMPIFFLLGALVLMVVFRLLGGDVGFKGSLAVLSHAAVPMAIAAVLGALVVVFAATPPTVTDAQTGGLLASNLAVLAPEGSSPVLLSLLASIDLFSIWTVILVAIGFACVAGVSTTTAAITSFLMWAVLVAIRVGLALLGTLAGGGG